MARYRTYKPELFADEKLNELPVEARFLFLGLLPFVDDMGRRRYHPRRIKLEVFPGDARITEKVVDGWIRDLERLGIVRLYSIENQKNQLFLWIPNFLRHQKIDRPSHTDIPPHPRDPDPDCQCVLCKIERGELSSSNQHNRSNAPRVKNVPAGTPRGLPEDSGTRGVLLEGSRCSVSSVVTKLNLNLSSHDSEPSQEPPPSPPDLLAQSSQENRRTQRSALDEIATRMLRLLELKVNYELLQAVTRSITIKARSKGASIEAAAQQIAARAAFVAAESPPENWLQWFGDVGYEYVPQGDERLKDKHIDARPVCGGSLCQEGWETVKVGGLPVLRRCPDCERLWRDQGC